jgi:hypothetical protein
LTRRSIFTFADSEKMDVPVARIAARKRAKGRGMTTGND